MSVNIQEISYNVMVNIMSQMDMASLAKMRRTGTYAKNLIEENRNRIRARSSGTPVILKICVDEKKMSLVTKVAYKAFEWEQHDQLSYHMELIPDEEFVLIENPVVQLSAVKFDYVLLDFDFQLVGETAIKMQENMASQAAVVEQVFPLLDKLRLHCDWLCLKITRWNYEKTSEILTKIFCKKLFFSGPCTSNDIEQWPIQNYEVFHIGTLKEVPERISPMITTASCASMMFDVEAGVEKMVENFLLENKYDRSARGNLLKFVVHAVGVEELNEIEGLEIIWEGENECEDDIVVYKMKVDGAIAYIKLWRESYELHFYEEECDDQMINDLTCCRCEEPCDYF